MAFQILPPPVTGSDPDLLTVLNGYYQALLELQQPGSPVVLPKMPLAADLPPAADYPDTVIQAVDKNCIAVSTETSPGVWAWKRADGSAL